MIEAPEYFKHISDVDLIDVIHNQQAVVDDCIENAQRKAVATDDDCRHSCTGLYFANLRLTQLTGELENRFTKLSRNINNKILNNG